MGKKKRGGGNKKNNAGGRGGRNPSAGDSTKKQFCGRREMPQPPIKIDDENGIDEAKAATTKELEGVQSDNFAGGVRRSDDGDGNFTGDVQLLPPPTELEDETTEKVIDDGSKVAHVNKTSSSGYVAADKIETDVSNNAAATEAASDNKVEAIPTSNEKEDVDTPTAVEDKVDTEIEPADSKDVPLSDINHDPFSDGTDSANASPINDAVKEESADTCLVDGADATEPSTEVETVEIGTIHVDNDVSSQSEVMVGIKKNTSSINGNETLASVDSFSGDDDIAQATKEIGPYSSQLSLGMEEVDLDASEKHETPPPLARAFNGTPNGLSPATDSSLSFSFQDSIENEAFVFLTASLRENLGDDANGVSDDTLSRYIRWKPDVNRAADRFHAYQKFCKENSYVFDDKPLLLSQDPKLTFLIQNGMVIAPEELVAKDGSGVVILRAAKCDVSAHGCGDQDASRAILYVLQKMVERNTLDPLKGITIVLDLVGVTRRNIPRRLANLLSKAAECFPLRVQAIYVVAMPWWFSAGHRKLFSIKMRSRIHLLKDKTALFEFIEKDRLLEEDGGIYNFDLQTWISSTVLDEVEQLG